MKRKYTPEELIGIVREVLGKVSDKVLAYKVPARSPKAKKRQRKRRKVQRESCI